MSITLPATSVDGLISGVSRDYDIERIRADFPILKRTIRGKTLVYLDTAATAQRPLRVIEAVDAFSRGYNANIHRAVHHLSVEATEAFEGARNILRGFINADSIREIIFTRGATESLNIAAQCYAASVLEPGDVILLSNLEHHSNIVPWQMVCEKTGATIKVIPIDDRGEILLDEYEKLLTDRVKIVAVQHVSNSLGTIHPLKKIVGMAHRAGAVVVVDGAQGPPHLKVDVQDLGCDFYAISGHKMYGPTGAGVLYGKRELLEKMPPWLGGGDMIKSVTFEKTIYADPPAKFEAGTPNIAGVIGLGVAAKYLEEAGIERIAAHERDLLDYATPRLETIDGLRIFGKAAHKSGVVSFTLKDIHPHDIGTVLDTEGIAVRTGHHCTQPLMERLGVAATARASFGMYTTRQEIDRLVEGLHKVIEVFG